MADGSVGLAQLQFSNSVGHSTVFKRFYWRLWPGRQSLRERLRTHKVCKNIQDDNSDFTLITESSP